MPERHGGQRGPGTFKSTLDGLIWLAQSGFKVTLILLAALIVAR